MPLKTKVDGAIKEMVNCKVKVGGAWKQGVEVLTKENGVWKKVWRNSTVVIINGKEELTFPIKNYKGYGAEVLIKNVKLRLYYSDKTLITEQYLGDVTVTSDSSPLIDIIRSGTDWSVSLAIHFIGTDIVIYTTKSPSTTSFYGEFEFDEITQ